MTGGWGKHCHWAQVTRGGGGGIQHAQRAHHDPRLLGGGGGGGHARKYSGHHQSKVPRDKLVPNFPRDTEGPNPPEAPR